MTSDDNHHEAPLLPKPSDASRQSRQWTAAAMAAITAAGVVVLIFLQCVATRGPGAYAGVTVTRSRIVEADAGVVAADSVLCSDIGTDVLKKGGNAIDSAIATAFCQGVANPGASGIGGGDFMLVRLADGRSEAFDFREVAPLGASESMYANNLESKSLGALSIAVPGEVKGLYKAWESYGTLPWESLVEPAIRLAADGFPVPPYLASQIQSSLSAILAYKGLRDVFAPNGIPLLEGDMYYHKTLAQTLKKIAERGSDAFYKGEIARALVEDVQAAGGILTLKDLQSYRLKVTKPVVADAFGHTIIGFPPPSSGGPGLILILNILGAYKNANAATKGDLGLHHIIEAFKHTYAIRSHLGDPAFVNVSSVVKDMTSSEFAATLQKTIADNTTFGPNHYGGKYDILNQGDEHGTSHISIVDGDRNSVAMTCTINYGFGSKLMSEQTGVLLNNEMDDFATPQDNTTNGPPATPNFIRPKKRPLSTMSPTIVLKNGQLRAVVGGSGGLKILTTVAQVLFNVFAGYDPLTAVQRPRVHHQFLPNEVTYENFTTVTGELLEVAEHSRQSLIDKGHVLSSGSSGAVSQLVLHDLTRPANLNRTRKNKTVFFGKLIGVSDSRKDGYPSGY